MYDSTIFYMFLKYYKETHCIWTFIVRGVYLQYIHIYIYTLYAILYIMLYYIVYYMYIIYVI